jgi:iron complex outermembrane recepter protein
VQRPYVWAAGLTLALFVTAHLARADEAMPDAAAPQQSASGAASLEEIIVYARRREERAEDTPLAVSVRSGEQLREANAVLLEDIDRDIPNTRMVSSPQSVSALDVTIRGQTVIRSAIMFDPAVGLYVDGVYVANGQGAMATLLDMDSVEVLRGSQGTLFGRDNTGGSILLMTHRPELQQLSGEVALSGGTTTRSWIGPSSIFPLETTSRCASPIRAMTAAALARVSARGRTIS